ncbi:MAG TPA: S8 family serine peptidase [Myxococcales bacterium]|nr:S8 family serine peptidase [Myxococcales bacterium]
MHRTCNAADRPLASPDSTGWIDRLAPDDPLLDADEVEIPHAERIRRRRPRRAAARAAAALALAVEACGGAAFAPQQASDSILVQLERDDEPPSFPSAAGDGAPIVALRSVGPDDAPAMLRLPLPAGEDPVDFARETALRPGVEFAEPVFLYQSTRVPNDPRFKDLWGLTAIDAPGAWASAVGDRRVTVAVVDDGVALTHPDLAPNLWINPSEIAGNGRDDDGDGYVDDVNGYDFVAGRGDPSPARSGEERWHGTHVAGTIGAAGDNRIGICGVNWKVSLMALRGIGPRGGRSDDLARAIDYAVDHGARVVNASWGGGGHSQAIAKAVARARERGVLFVPAAGNEGASRPSFPANLGGDNVLSVGAVAPDGRLASFSNRGALVAAPGVGILSTTAPGRYERYDGTSMAAPHVSGLAALLWAARPQARLEEVREAILSSASPVPGTRNGRIDAARAMAALLGGPGAGSSGNLLLSRGSLSFTSSGGGAPRAQTISLRAEGGDAKRWTARPDARWVRSSPDQGETPGRLTVRVDPSGLQPGEHVAHVRIESADRPPQAVVLEVRLRIGDGPAVAANGSGCGLREGRLHVGRGATCRLAIPGLGAGATASSVQWRLPGGAVVQGGSMYAQFLMRGEYTVEVSGTEEGSQPVTVVVE